MTEQEFSEFRDFSQLNYANRFSESERVPLASACEHASVQFLRLVPNGVQTENQLFFKATVISTGQPIGYLWLGVQERFGRKVASINDIYVSDKYRGRGFGRSLMILAEEQAKTLKAQRLRLHVFQSNKVAQNLYFAMGFETTDLDMSKDI